MALRLLSDGALARMRTLLEASLLDTAIVTTVTATVDAMGSWTEGSAHSAAVPCRITAPIRLGHEGVTADTIEAFAEWVIVFSTRQLAAAAIAITEGSLIVARGVTYQVRQVQAPQTHDISTRVLVVKGT